MNFLADPFNDETILYFNSCCFPSMYTLSLPQKVDLTSFLMAEDFLKFLRVMSHQLFILSTSKIKKN